MDIEATTCRGMHWPRPEAATRNGSAACCDYYFFVPPSEHNWLQKVLCTSAVLICSLTVGRSFARDNNSKVDKKTGTMETQIYTSQGSHGRIVGRQRSQVAGEDIATAIVTRPSPCVDSYKLSDSSHLGYNC